MLFCKLLCHGTGSMQYHAVLLGVERLLLSPLPVSPRSDSQMKPVSARCPVWTKKSYFGKLTCLISLHPLPHHSLCLPVQLWKKKLFNCASFCLCTVLGPVTSRLTMTDCYAINISTALHGKIPLPSFRFWNRNLEVNQLRA